MANGNVDLLRQIAVLAQLMYDKSGVAELMKDSDRAIAKLLEVANTYNIVSKAAKAYDQREIATETARVKLESQKLTIAQKKLTVANKEVSLLNKDLDQTSKQLRIANQKQALANKELASESKKLGLENKKLTNEQKRLYLEQQKSRAEQMAKGYRKQSQAARGLAVSLDGVKEGLIAIGAVAGAQGLFNIARNVEQVGFRIRNFVQQAQFAALQRRFKELNKQTDGLFSVTAFEQSAAAVFNVDRNTRRFARTLEFAVKMAPVLGKSLKDIQLGIAQDIVEGGTAALEELGIVTRTELENMRRRTGLAFGDLRLREREKFVFDRLKLTPAQLELANRASKGLNATWRRFLSLLSGVNRILQKDFLPVAIFILDKITKFLRMLLASPIGVFALRVGGLIAGIAALALGIGALTKALAFLRGMLLLTNKATLLLWGKFLLIGSLVLSLILIIDDFWLALENPEADAVFKPFFDKYPKVRNLLINLKNLWNEANDPENIRRLNQVLDEPKWPPPWAIALKDWIENDLTDAFMKIDTLLENFVGKWIDRLLLAGRLFKNLFRSTAGSPIETFPETGGLTGFAPAPGPRGIPGEDISALLNLLNTGFAPRGFNLSPSPQTISNITYINIDGIQSTVQAGLDRSEILELSVDTFRTEMEKQLIEADIGGR